MNKRYGCMSRLIILVLPLFMLSGCAEIQQYPDNWPKPILLSGGCSDLIGIYHGTVTVEDYRVNLVEILEGYTRKPKKHGDRVELTVPKIGTLKIVAYDNKTVVNELKFSEQDKTLSCGSMEAVLAVFKGMVAQEGVLAHSTTTVSLSKDKDGYLIVKSDESGIGSYGCLIPFSVKQRRWYRFAPYVFESDAVPNKQ